VTAPGTFAAYRPRLAVSWTLAGVSPKPKNKFRMDGQFLKWIRAEFGWSVGSAHAFMEVHRQFKSASPADLKIDVSALYLLAAPKTPEPVRAEIMRRAEAGEQITHKAARTAIAQYKNTGATSSSRVTEKCEEKRQEIEGVSQAVEILAAMIRRRPVPRSRTFRPRCAPVFGARLTERGKS
jgi:hypothetical protein